MVHLIGTKSKAGAKPLSKQNITVLIKLMEASSLLPSKNKLSV
jgi:hypothetical protein